MINEIWIAEFRGLFWGEGCADIQRYNRKPRGVLYRPRLRMQLRADDKELLENIQQNLGGTLNYIANTNQRSKPAYQWTLARKDEIVWLCDRLLEGQLPAKKRDQIELVREAAVLRAGKLGHLTEGEKHRIEDLYKKVQELKRFE